LGAGMTRREFIDRKQRFDNRTWWVMEVLVVSAILGCVGLGVLIDLVKAAPGIAWAAENSMILMGALLIGTLRLGMWLQGRQARREGLLCPSCGAALINNLGELAGATGLCRRGGR